MSRSLFTLATAALCALCACKTTSSASSEASGAAPVRAVAPDGGGDGPKPAPAEAGQPVSKTKGAQLLAEGGSLSYVAEGGRSPFASISCGISWKDGGESGRATVGIEVRTGKFKSVKRDDGLGAERLRAAFDAALDFDPLTLAEEQPAVSATDMHTYTVEVHLGGKKKTVSGYGLEEGTPFERLVHTLDDLCGLEGAMEESRGG